MTQPNNHPGSGPDATGCDDLLLRLSEEQAALEQVLFKLREQNLVLAAGEHRWLPQCTSELQAAVEVMLAAGQRREIVAATVHAAHGLDSGASLGALAERVADELTGQRLVQRRRELRDCLDQVRRCSRQNREMLAQGLAATNDALALLGSVPTYDSAGGLSTSSRGRPGTFEARV